MSGPEQNTCLPNGTYTPPSGAWGFDMGVADNFTLPLGGTLNIRLSYLSGPYTPVHVNVTLDNTTSPASRKLFKTNAALMGHFGGALNVFVPGHPPPGACLFQRPDFQGDVACFGPGGGNLSAPVASMAQSVRVVGGANVWVYAQGYNDTGGALVGNDVRDLTSLVYGRNDNFNKKIKALWISAPSSG